MEIKTLQFQTPHDLAAFRKTVQSPIIRTDIAELRVTCKCTPEDVELAMKNFKATVVDVDYIG